MFTLTIRNLDGYFAKADIMIGSLQKAIVSSWDVTDAYIANQASNSVIEECQAGEHVWVRSDCRSNSGYFSGRYTIFSGFLIQ